MKRNVIIIPKVIERYKKQYEYSIEINLLKFIKYVNNNFTIQIFDKNKEYSKKDIFIFSGGNNIINFSKSEHDLIRSKLDKLALKNALYLGAKIIGICHGAHFLASQNKGTFSINKKHNNSKHKIKIENNKRIVNSFHNVVIHSLSKKNKILAFSDDNSIELFENKEMNYLGMIWHPERNKKFNIEDKKIIQKFLCN